MSKYNNVRNIISEKINLIYYRNNIIKFLFIFFQIFIFISFIKRKASKRSENKGNKVPIIKLDKNNIDKLKVKNNINKKITIKSVLFINGCDPKILPQSYRYRVLHQMEQLEAGFLECDEFYYLNFEPFIIRNYRVIIFVRCPWTKKVEEAINLAKNLNKKVLFDIDDLVIDTKYIKLIPYINTMTQREKNKYEYDAKIMGKTLKHCDGVITTTKALAKEIKNYVPNVFINHNVASEEMWKLSELALKNIKNRFNMTKKDSLIIGYFSESITHNSDIEIIKSALNKILKEFKNVLLLILGKLKYPDFLKEFSDQIIIRKFVDWRDLPELISNIDINIVPIEDTIFNQAKSENKWVVAALVKVPTIASNIGEFKNAIRHNETGLLCNNTNDWYISLKILINNKTLRKEIGKNAYNFCKMEYNTIYTGRRLTKFINSIANRHIGFFLPGFIISGGMYVIFKHACILKDKGWDIDLIFPKAKIRFLEFQKHKFNVIGLNNSKISTTFDITVATLFTTLFNTLNIYNTKKHLYLVQNYETDFFPLGNSLRISAEKTYSTIFNVEYITVSKWCQNWLFEKYEKKSKYAPNGIDLDHYTSHKRAFKNRKIIILIEGDSNSYHKNVDESFKIVENLDKNKYEIWYLSYNGKPKEWYRVDNFFFKVPYEKVGLIYEKCDILLKSSWLESFSYPPIEMMATGGYVVVVSNDGNREYLKDGYNCLIYKLGDINSAISCIQKLVSDEKLQQRLYVNGLETAKKRDWKNFKDQIISLYIDQKLIE